MIRLRLRQLPPGATREDIEHRWKPIGLLPSGLEKRRRLPRDVDRRRLNEARAIVADLLELPPRTRRFSVASGEPPDVRGRRPPTGWFDRRAKHGCGPDSRIRGGGRAANRQSVDREPATRVCFSARLGHLADEIYSDLQQGRPAGAFCESSAFMGERLDIAISLGKRRCPADVILGMAASAAIVDIWTMPETEAASTKNHFGTACPSKRQRNRRRHDARPQLWRALAALHREKVRSAVVSGRRGPYRGGRFHEVIADTRLDRLPCPTAGGLWAGPSAACWSNCATAWLNPPEWVEWGGRRPRRSASPGSAQRRRRRSISWTPPPARKKAPFSACFANENSFCQGVALFSAADPFFTASN